MALYQVYQRMIRGRLLTTFQHFFKSEVTGGAILLLCTIIALIFANSPYSEHYERIWQTPFSIGLGNMFFYKPLHFWINDFLMVIFFFVVGLEIKREMLVGKLSTLKTASLPIIAAFGGMIIPAIIYYIVNHNSVGQSGWGIPMETDIAFALGILALLGKRVPIGIKIFLVALAIADDLGGVLVIALFYTGMINWTSLFSGLLFFIALLLLNLLRVNKPFPYILLGIGLWLGLLHSGIHPTIAGVLLAISIPSTVRIDNEEFRKQSRLLIYDIEKSSKYGEHILSNEELKHSLRELRSLSIDVSTPMQEFEHALLPWVNYFIVPLFALSNAGVHLGNGLKGIYTNKIVLGIILGLFLGKQIGITLFTWLAVKLKLSELPQGAQWHHVWGVGILGGIGFTMSLFVASLAFSNNELLNDAKIGILIASAISGFVGFAFLTIVSKYKKQIT